MLKKIAKFFVTAVITFLLAVAAWYFLLLRIPENICVFGTAAPALSREQGQVLLHRHGVRVAYVKGGCWYFKRDGEECRLIPGK